MKRSSLTTRSLRALGVAAIGALSVATTVSASSVALTGPSLPHLESDITASAALTRLPNLVVPLSALAYDNAARISRDCLVAPTAATALGSRSNNCYFGDLAAKRTMVLFGDSNAWMWLPTFDAIGRADEFRVELEARSSCEVASLPMFNNSGTTLAGAQGCGLFRAYALGQIAATKPFLVVVVDYEYTDHFTYHMVQYSASTYHAALTKTIETIDKSAGTTVMLSPPPPHFTSLLTCLSQHLARIQACATPTLCLDGNDYRYAQCQWPSNSYDSIQNIIGLPQAVKDGHGVFLNVSKIFCTSRTCPPVVADTVTMFDQTHVSYHYAVLVDAALQSLFPSGLLTGGKP